MKRILTWLLLLATAFILIGCDPLENGPINPEDPIPYLDIYTLNDLHGAVEDTQGRGIARIGNYLITQKENNPNGTVIVTAGDMLQGTGISSLTKGNVVIGALNKIGIDAFTIGNHEFDWGIDEIRKFHDPEQDNVQAEFPFLGANIYEREDNSQVDWADTHVIIERSGIRIGIIGILGEYQVNSIAPGLVAPYIFLNPIDVIRDITYDLRTNENIDIVIVNAHESGDAFNQALANLSGDYRIDAVTNGHTHRTYAQEFQRANYARLPVVQSGSSGSHIGHIRLYWDHNTRIVTNVNARNIEVRETLTTNHPEILSYVMTIKEEVDIILQETLAIAGQYIGRSEGTQWAANIIQRASGASIGAVNNAGIRAPAFPIYKDEAVTVARIYELMPFDNFVKTARMSPQEIRNLIANNSNWLTFSDNVSIVGNTVYVGGVALDESLKYVVATMDYVFDQENVGFLDAEDQIYTGVLFRDYLIEELRQAQNGVWFLQ